MSALQDQLDKGLNIAGELNDRWDEEMEENERLGLHARMHAYLLANHPGPDVDADEFFGQWIRQAS
jgi:hypothetical protein